MKMDRNIALMSGNSRRQNHAPGHDRGLGASLPSGRPERVARSGGAASRRGLGLRAAALVALAIVMVSVMPGCDRLGFGFGSGSGHALGLVPDSANWVIVLDVGAIQRGEIPAVSTIGEAKNSLDIQIIEDNWEELGIAIGDVNTLVYTDSIFVILAGEFDFEEIRHTISADRGPNYRAREYREYELWEDESGGAITLLEDGKYVAWDEFYKVKNVLRSLSEDHKLLQDDENPLKRALDRVGRGWLISASKNCRIQVGGCEAVAIAAANDGGLSVELTLVHLFRSLRAAESAVGDIEGRLEIIHDNARSFDYDDVKADGEFTVVKMSVDEDDLGHLDSLWRP